LEDRDKEPRTMTEVRVVQQRGEGITGPTRYGNIFRKSISTTGIHQGSMHTCITHVLTTYSKEPKDAKKE
jgi:hypothetical protein